MRLSLTADEIATLILALQDREAILNRCGGRGPLVTTAAAACWALRTKLSQALKPAKPKRKSRTQRAYNKQRDAEINAVLQAACIPQP